MRLVFKVILYLVVAGALTLLGIAVFSDLPAPQREITQPVEAK